MPPAMYKASIIRGGFMTDIHQEITDQILIAKGLLAEPMQAVA